LEREESRDGDELKCRKHGSIKAGHQKLERKID
jgi:hypothetical protein